MNAISKKIVAIVAGATLIAANLASPASAAGWKGGHHHGGYGGGAAAAGVLGVLALGAIAASAAAASAEPTNCVIEKRPAYNAYGNFVGYKKIRVCD
jgi:hypothetical protein